MRKLTESDLNRIILKVIKETEETQVDVSKFRQFIPLLQRINYDINMKEVIRWFNDTDTDYIGLNDLEMIIIYIARNS